MSLIRYLTPLMQSASQILLPWTCILCKQPADRKQDLCNKCLATLPAFPHACYRCGNRLAAKTMAACGSCQQSPPPFDAAHALFAWRPPVTRLLTQLKFYHNLTNARIFAGLLEEKITGTWYEEKCLPDAILPVPLHPARLRQRGYNQSLEIAKPLARNLAIPLLTHLCARTRPTLPQTSLPAEERQKNMRNAFILREDAISLPAGMRIAVLDDVITTGSTLRALCDTLKKKLACRIDVWCCARV